MLAEFLSGLLEWLDLHAGAILLAGAALSVGVNLRAFQADRRAARRLQQAARPRALPALPPRVSFLVPAWDEAPHMEACLRSILGLRYPAKELVLCAGGADGTLALCRQYAGAGVIVLAQQPGEGKQRALQRCFERSNGEILFLTDADCVVDDASVEATLAPLILDGQQAATGYWRPFEALVGQPFVAFQWANHLRYQANCSEWADTLDGRNSAIRREALLAAGSFQAEAATGTDYVLSRQLQAAGFRICSILESRVQTEYPVELAAFVRQGSRWSRNRLVQGVRYRQWGDVLRSLWGAFAALWLLGGWLALPLGWQAAGGAWLATLLHLVLARARLAGFWKLSGLGSGAFAANVVRFSAYTLLSNAAMLRGLLTSLRRQARRTW